MSRARNPKVEVTPEVLELLNLIAKRLNIPRIEAIGFIALEHLAAPALTAFVERAGTLPQPLIDAEVLSTENGTPALELRERYEAMRQQMQG